MKEIFEELPKVEQTNNQTKAYFVYFVLFAVVVLSAYYVATTIWGARSLDVMIELEKERENLKIKVAKLQEQNSALQKEYFELIGLDPDNYKTR